MRTNCFSPARSFLIPSLLWLVVFGSSNAVAGTVVAHWIGGSGNWSSSANWDIGKVPNNSGGTNYDVVVNVPATNATIIIDQSVTINSLSNAETVVIASGTNAISQWTINSGSIQMTGAVAQLTLSGSINNLGQMTATTGTLYLTSATLTCTTATARVTANCQGSLTNVNLTASGGGVIAFPGATNFVSDDWGNTLQASGPGSRIDLSGLARFAGGYWWDRETTQIKALAGGQIDLGGQFSGSTTWTLQGAGSLFNTANLTALSDATLSVSNGLTLTFPAARTLTNVNLTASAGGVIAFPAATNYTGVNTFGNTLQASGPGSRIDLSGLARFAGGDTQLQALNGGEIDLGGQFSGSTTWTLQGAGSLFNAANLTALSDATLSVSNGLLTFPAVRVLTSVNLTAGSGGVIAFPSATNFVSDDWGNTLQASGPGSRIDLSGLTRFGGGYWDPTQIAALNGGEVDLGGQFSGSTTWTLQGTGSLFNTANLTALSDATLSVSNGLTLTFPAARVLTNVNLTASAGGVIAFPSATNYTSSTSGNAILASGPGSRIDLSSLTRFVGGGIWDWESTQIKALAGGEVDLGGAFSGNTAWTLQGTGSLFNTANLTALSDATLSVSNGLTLTFPAARALTNVNLTASSGGVIAFPSATNYTTHNYPTSGNTIQASGPGSRIDLSSLTKFVGGVYYDVTQIAALNGGEVDLGGQFSGKTVCTWNGVGSFINLGKVTKLTGVQLIASNGGTLVIPLTNHITWVGTNSISAIGTGSRVINQGPLVASASGCTITINDTNFTNAGELGAANGGVIDINGTMIVNEPGRLRGAVSGTITIAGDLLGNTRNADQYAPLSEVRFDGAGSNAAPQLLEVMGRDLGATNAGFSQNFVYNTLSLAHNTYMRLVDLSDNAPGSNAEALYVNSLIVPSGTTLDLNGLHLYARATQTSGTILGGVVTQIPDSGPIALASPTPGSIGLAGELDEWTFFGRAGREVTVVVNPGGSGSPAPLPPYLNWATVKLLDATTNVLAAATNSSAGQILTLNDVTLPADGTYRVQVRAAPQHSSSTGNYVVTAWDVTANVAALPLNQQRNGNIETPYAVDRWTFSAVAGQQIRFHLIMVSGPGVAFDLRRDNAPPGEYLFQDLTGNSDLFTLANSGGYTLTAYGTGGQYGIAYAFSMDETLQTSLPPGTTFNGTFNGSGQAQIFYVNLTNSGPLQMVLNGIPAGSRVELYAKLGSPPTRADYDYRSVNPSAGTLQLLVSLAPAGTWYFLVYADYIPVPGAYTLAPAASGLALTAVTPSRNANNVDATLTLTGAGFDSTTTVALVAANGTNAASAVSVDSFTQITATFAANTVPAGIYSVRVSKPGASDQLSNAFQMISGGQANLVTRLIVPSQLGYHGVATVYVEYSNTGDAAMPAPLLVLTATQNGREGAFLTLQSMGLVQGFWTSAQPEGFSHSIQILASGAIPGVLQPGESMRVPVYYAGWQQPWDFTYPPINWNLGVLKTDDTTPVNWAALKDNMKPASISAEAWDALWPAFVSQVGTTWGDYVKMLDDNAAYLGRLGQRVLDVGHLLGFEFQQTDGLSPIRSLASAVDAAVEAPGLPVTFARTFSQPISQRHQLSALGYGWSHNWQYSLQVTNLATQTNDGTVTVLGPGGSRRVFQPDSRCSSYFAQPGDHATLSSLGGGVFTMREPNGLLYAFRSDGKLNYIEDTNGNRITCGYAGNLLTSLTHSSGQSLQIAYTGAARVQQITGSDGRQTLFTYNSDHLTSIQAYDGRTTGYSYSLGQGGAKEHALTQINFPGSSHRYFTYDAQGRLLSTYRDGNAEVITFTCDDAGKVTATDALGGVSKFYFDHRGLLVKTEDALGNAVHLAFDDNYNLVRLADPAGRSYDFAYDGNGNLTQSIDPLGHASLFTFHASLNRLSSVTCYELF